MVKVEKLLTFTGHKDAVYTLESSGSPDVFFSAGGDGHVVAWDINNPSSGRLIAKVSASVYALHYLESKNWLVVGQNYEGIHLIDLKTNKEHGSLKLTDGAIYEMKSFGHLLLVAAAKGQFFVVDLDQMIVLKEIKVGEHNLRDIYIQNEEFFYVASSDGFIRKFCWSDLKCIHQVHGHDPAAFSVTMPKGCQQMISAGRDAKLKFWEVNEGFQLQETVNAHMYAINDLAFSPTEQYFATASMDKTIKIWDYNKRKLLKVIDKARHDGHLTSVNKLLWLVEKDYLVSCSDDRSIGVWRLEIGK